MSPETGELLPFLRACADGDVAARQRFQNEYGEDIYNFPVKIYSTPLEEAGDFYLYAFEDDRVFSRIRTFEGRNSIQFRTFLSYYVLKHLFLEWRRTKKEIDTISLSTPLGDGEAGGRVLEDILSSEDVREMSDRGGEAGQSSSELWNMLTAEERLDLKLLSLLECDLTPDEVRLLAQTSGRSIIDTLALVTEVQDGLKRKDEKLTRLRDDLDSVWGWILLRQKELQEIGKKMLLIEAQGDSAGKAQVRAQQAEVESALAKRHRQKEKITEEMRTYKMTTPYKDIARLLNLTVGTVCSRIFRLRERLTRESGEQWSPEEHAL
jgi:RNA polymerase sigma factor (sigma-70 family)